MKKWNGKRLADLRRCMRPRITQAKLAELIGTHQATVVSWENGLHVPNADWLPKIAAAFGCRIEDLFEEERA